MTITRRTLTRTAGLAAIALAIAGCTNPAPISTNPVQSAANDVTTLLPGTKTTQATVTQGLTDAQWNLQQAQAIGVLAATDPALPCLNGVLAQLGVGGTPPASFTPRESDLISTGSVLYIQIQQAKQLRAGGLAVPAACQALIGMFVIDASSVGIKGLPGGGILPTLTSGP
jgi:hypothetical protein